MGLLWIAAHPSGAAVRKRQILSRPGVPILRRAFCLGVVVRKRVITGAQIREARALLGWPPSTLARRTKLQSSTIWRAEADAGAGITARQSDTIQQVLEAAGVEFGELGVRLRKAKP